LPAWSTNAFSRLQQPGQDRLTSSPVCKSARSQLPPAAARLQAINKAFIEKQGEEDAKISAKQSREEVRRELFRAAEGTLYRILETLRERVLEAAPATLVSTNHGLTFRLGDGVLIVDPLQMAPADCLAAFDYELAFDVIAYTAIAVRKPRDRYDYEGRAHSWWFCDAQEEGVYRWYELAFMVQPLIAQRCALDPFALPPTDRDAACAFTPVMGVRQIAWHPLPLDQGDEEQFLERWLTWFAAAADGTLRHPSSMPENSGCARRTRKESGCG
jgi:hypothetical protein